MAFVATGRGMKPAELMARTGHLFPERWSVDVEPTTYGALLVAGADRLSDDEWLVLGRPSLDPWGDPTTPQPLSAALGELAAMGPRAVDMWAGPALAVHRSTGDGFRTLNGLIGFGPQPEDPRVWSVAGVSDPPATSEPVVDMSPGFRLDRLLQEVDSRTPPLGGRLDIDAPWFDGEIRGCAEPGVAIALPRNRASVLSDGYLLRHFRDVTIPLLQSHCLAIGHWLYAPLLERPCIDQVGFGLVS